MYGFTLQGIMDLDHSQVRYQAVKFVSAFSLQNPFQTVNGQLQFCDRTLIYKKMQPPPWDEGDESEDGLDEWHDETNEEPQSDTEAPVDKPCSVRLFLLSAAVSWTVAPPTVTGCAGSKQPLVVVVFSPPTWQDM